MSGRSPSHTGAASVYGWNELCPVCFPVPKQLRSPTSGQELGENATQLKHEFESRRRTPSIRSLRSDENAAKRRRPATQARGVRSKTQPESFLQLIYRQVNVVSPDGRRSIRRMATFNMSVHNVVSRTSWAMSSNP